MRIPVAAITRAGALLLTATAACASPAGKKATPQAPEKKVNRVAAGTWGGVGIGLEVTGNGGTLEFDCAHGTFSQPLLLDENGRFDVKGLHVPEHGGPVREGEVVQGRPVRYSGLVTGDTMTLTIRSERTDGPTGSFDLAFGKSGRLRKCL